MLLYYTTTYKFYFRMLQLRTDTSVSNFFKYSSKGSEDVPNYYYSRLSDVLTEL